MRKVLRIGLVGAGFVGRKHARYVLAAEDCHLAAIADPSPTAEAFAAKTGADYFVDFEMMLERAALDGVIIATPNDLHERAGILAASRGLPMIVEKPIAADLEAAARLSETAERAGVALLVGHHRRYNRQAQKAKTMIEAGSLGRLIGVNVVWCVHKPDDYFQAAWRQKAGGGPILINLIHEIDMLRFLCGEIAEVMAMSSNGIRGFDVEDSAALILRFSSGVLGTVLISDAAPSPWSWEQGTGENHPTFPENGQNATRFFGSEAAMDFPNLTVWRHEGPMSWHSPLSAKPQVVPKVDVFSEQIAHFVRVIRGEEAPIITGRDASLSLAATLAVIDAAATKTAVVLE